MANSKNINKSENYNWGYPLPYPQIYHLSQLQGNRKHLSSCVPLTVTLDLSTFSV